MSDFFDDPLGNLEFETESKKAEELHAGNSPTVAGYYHVTVEPGISASDSKPEELMYVQLDLRILDGCDMDKKPRPDQKDKILKHRIYVEGWAKKGEKGVQRTDFEKSKMSEKNATGLKVLFYAAGVIGESELEATTFKPKFRALEGRQFIAKLTEDEFTGKDGKAKTSIKLNWNNDTWPLGHEQVADVPVNRMLALAGGYQLNGQQAVGAGAGKAPVDLANMV